MGAVPEPMGQTLNTIFFYVFFTVSYFPDCIFRVGPLSAPQSYTITRLGLPARSLHTDMYVSPTNNHIYIYNDYIPFAISLLHHSTVFVGKNKDRGSSLSLQPQSILSLVLSTTEKSKLPITRTQLLGVARDLYYYYYYIFRGGVREVCKLLRRQGKIQKL